MKKFLYLLFVGLLVAQVFFPYLAKADNTEESASLDLTKVEQKEEQPTKENQFTFNVAAHIKNGTTEPQKTSITVSKNVSLQLENEGAILDENKSIIGKYEINGNEIQFDIPAEVDTEISFEITTKYLETDSELEKDTVEFQTATNQLSSEVTLYQEPKETEPPKVEEKEPTKEPTTEKEPTNKPEAKQPETKKSSENKAALADEPQNVKDIFTSLGYPEEDATILTGMELTFFDKDGNPVENPTVEDYIHFTFYWEIPNDVGDEIQAGDYYTVQLPNTIKVAQNQTISLAPYANVEISTNGTLTFVFTDEVKEHSNVHGTLEFDAELNPKNIDGPGEITIKIPFEDNIPPVDINVKPAVESTIEKNGHFDKELNPDFIDWEVDINKSLDTIDRAVVTESFPPGTTYQSVEVYKVQVDLFGVVYPGSEQLVTSGYTVDAAGNVTFTTPISDAYRLKYTTKINEDAKPEAGGSKTFENTATLNADGTQLPAKASVAGAYGKLLTKQSSNYDPATQTSDWTVKYNYGEKTISKSDATIHDEFGDSRMKLVDGSVKATIITFDADGTEIPGAQLVEGTDYKIEMTANGFDIVFLHDINYAVKITYKTTVTGIIDDNVTIDNTVNTNSGESSNSSGGIIQQNVTKTVGDIDYDLKEVSWQIDVNKNHYMMKGWKLTDQLSPGLTLLRETFVMKDMVTGENLTEDQDYSLVYNGPYGEFTVELLGDYAVGTDHDFRITYTTAFNTSVDGVNDPDRIFPNNATTTWIDESDNPHTSSDGATFDPNDPAKYDGFKNGSYNAATARITWTIGVNYDNKELQSAVLVDPLQGDQQYVADSVKIYHYTVNPDGSIEKGAEIDNYGDFTISEPSASNNKTLTVRFPDEASAAYMVEFKTSLNGEVVEPTYDNDATFTNGDAQPHHLTAEVSIENGGNFVNKNGFQDEDGFANWSITVNPSGSTLNDVVVTDHPSSNQAIDQSSIVVYRTIVQPDGNIVKNPYFTLQEGTDYSVSLTTNPATGEQELKVEFLKQISNPYIIEYRSFVFVTNQPNQKLTNEVSVNGNNNVTISDGDSSTVDVVVLDGSGTAVGDMGDIVFQKVNSENQPLTGAEFSLWDKDKTTVLREATVDENGKLTFGNLPFGDYILQETKAPLGYTISDELMNGKKITISEATTDATDPTPIVNEPNKVILKKANATGTALSGAEFKLEQNIGGSWNAIRTDESFVTNQNGEIEIDGLLPGDYRLTETFAPPGYIVNTKPIPFTVAETAGGQIPDITLGPFINYTGSIEAVKQNESGENLAGAIFEVRDSEQKLVKRVISGRNGHIAVNNLAPGTYSLVEIRAPRGYILNTKPVEFTIPDAQEGNPGTIQLDPLINYKGSVVLVKNSDSGDKLSGVRFDLYNEDGTIVKRDLTTNKAGEIQVTNLNPGKYYFVETKAKAGYKLNSAKIEFEIAAESAGKPTRITVTAVNYAKDDPTIPPTNGTDGTNGTNETNGPGNNGTNVRIEQLNLPETGDTDNAIWWASLGLILISVASISLLRNSRRQH
ncbi:collagen binding domain-containing protein [Listeria seeligeri]|uniref:SpaA isopeptide-forming pilin-related protein n=1 Tax=Listeria seeligeri TaxID=1640 RepID=UPI0016299640|nr:SpaA isopeptide-forming pilin-related protein [Listeria seeligeri]MBC1725131.1 collagen binding domain-containing protein [Listeria seeligeri]